MDIDGRHATVRRDHRGDRRVEFSCLLPRLYGELLRPNAHSQLLNASDLFAGRASVEKNLAVLTSDLVLTFFQSGQVERRVPRYMYLTCRSTCRNPNVHVGSRVDAKTQSGG